MDPTSNAAESPSRPADGVISDTAVEISGLIHWLVTHSTRPLWHDKRNVRLAIPEKDSHAKYTYQDLGEATIHEIVVKSGDWRAVAKGKVGELPSGLRETPFGIEDSAGEVRGDWRATWAVVVIKSTNDATSWVDILSHRRPKNDGILAAVSRGLGLAWIEGLVDLAALKPVGIDDGRDEQDAKDQEERRKAAMRSGPETGIWRAEDDEPSAEPTDSRGLKCTSM